jgi:hypothetical protein
VLCLLALLYCVEVADINIFFFFWLFARLLAPKGVSEGACMVRLPLLQTHTHKHAHISIRMHAEVKRSTMLCPHSSAVSTGDRWPPLFRLFFYFIVRACVCCPLPRISASFGYLCSLPLSPRTHPHNNIIYHCYYYYYCCSSVLSATGASFALLPSPVAVDPLTLSSRALLVLFPVLTAVQHPPSLSQPSSSFFVEGAGRK